MAGILIFTRQNKQIKGTVIWSRKLYTQVQAADGTLYHLRTDRLAEGTETERGHISFKADR